MPSHLDLDFSSILNRCFFQLRPPELWKNMILAEAKNKNPTKSLFEVDIVFSLILGANMLAFYFQNTPTSLQNPILEGIDVLIEVGVDFLMIWARLWKPTWRHVAHFFLENVGPLWRDPLFFVGSMFFFRFLVSLALSWRLLGSILGGWGLILKVFWVPFYLYFSSLWTSFFQQP